MKHIIEIFEGLIIRMAAYCIVIYIALGILLVSHFLSHLFTSI